MSIKVLFFGKLAEVAQTELSMTELDCEDMADIHALKQHISTLSTVLHDEIEKPTNLIAVNQAIHKQNIPIHSGDEVAFMSPLSGG